MGRRDFIKKSALGTAALLIPFGKLEGIIEMPYNYALKKASYDEFKMDEFRELISYYEGLEVPYSKGNLNISDILLDNVLYALNKIISKEISRRERADLDNNKKRLASHEEFKHYFELLCSYIGKESRQFSLMPDNDAITLGAGIIGKRLAVPSEILISAAKKSSLLNVSIWEYLFPKKNQFEGWYGSILPKYNYENSRERYSQVVESIDELIAGVNKKMNLARNTFTDRKRTEEEVTLYINSICASIGLATYHPDFSLSKTLLKEQHYTVKKVKWFTNQGAKIARMRLGPHVKNAGRALKETPLYKNLKKEIKA